MAVKTQLFAVRAFGKWCVGNSSTITALGSVAQDAQARGYLQETVANLLITDRKTQASNDIIDGLANASTPVGLDSSTSKADAENTPTASKTSVGIVAVRDKNDAEVGLSN